ncbi:MAG: DUF2066 domain-containing protein [Pseudomonadota bacterium]
MAAVVALLLASVATTSAVTAQKADRIFTIANFPVEADAANAVLAKRKAVTEGRQAAFRSLLKRLVPVTSYAQLKAVKGLDPRSFDAGIAVKSEQNSGTRYVASLDFAFSPSVVRNTLRKYSIPHVEKQAAPTTLVVVYSPPAAGSAGITNDMTASEGTYLWTSYWKDQDLSNALTPLKVTKRKAQIRDDVVLSIAGGNMKSLRVLQTEYRDQNVVLAIAEPDPPSRQLNVVMAGKDAVGSFALKRRYRYEAEDFAYALELASVISLGIIEGRWKAVQSASRSATAGYTGAPLQDVQLWVAFADLGQWRSRQKVIAELPGVESFSTGGLSARGASVTLKFPGGGEQLRAALAIKGLQLEPYQGQWLMR